MKAFSNIVRQRLKRGDIVIGLNARHSRTSEIGAILKDSGYHFVFLDNEHSPLPTGVAYEVGLAAIRAGVIPLARVRSHDPAEIGSWMTNGVLGALIPHVNTREQAVRAVASCKYPPQGILSVPGYIPQFGYEGRPLSESAARFNREVLVVAMIETPEAVDNAEAIASVKGVDVLFIGASDLTFTMGIPSQYGHERHMNAIDSVCKAARKYGKAAGIGGLREPKDWERATRLGVRMLLTENDLAMLVARMTERAGFFLNLPTKAS